MHRTVLGFLRRALVVPRNHPPVRRLSSLACCLNSLDLQEPSQSSTCSEYRSQCLLPLITLAVRTSNWDVARTIRFRECVRLYGLSQSIGLFALLMLSFLPRRIREIRCLIQSIVDYCGNAGPDLFKLAPMLVNNLGGSMTLLQVYAAVIRLFVEFSMFEDALLTYTEAKKVGVELRLCNFLLKSLVKRNQIMYARSLFDDMKSSGPSPNVYSYSVLMSMYTHGDRLCLDEAFELLREMKMKGVRPNAATYGTYLYGLCRARQVTSAWDFLQKLCQRGYPCNSYCFNAVIHGFCHEGQVCKAKEVFDGMKEGGFVPDVHSYSILVDGLCKHGDLLTGRDMIVEMERIGITPTLVSYSSLLHGLCRAGKVELALELFKKLKDQGFKHDQIVYSIVLHGCCQHLDLEVACELWSDMVHHNFVPDVYNYTSLIYAFCRHRDLKEAWGVFQLMLDNGISPNIVACTILVDGFIKENQIGKAFLFLDKVRQFGIVPNLCTYRVIINGLCKVNKSNDVWEIFADMIKRGYLPDTVLYSIVIDGFVKALNLQEALRLYHKMLDEGTKPNIFMYTSLINGLCHDDRLPEVMTLFKHMVWEELTPDRILYTALIACYCKRSNMKAALEKFREMEKMGLSPDAFVYTCLIGGFSKVLAMDGALRLMEEMINKGLTPTVVTYTEIIIGYFKTGDEKKANMMYNSMLQAGITPDDKLSCILGLGNDEDDFEVGCSPGKGNSDFVWKALQIFLKLYEEPRKNACCALGGNYKLLMQMQSMLKVRNAPWSLYLLGLCLRTTEVFIRQIGSGSCKWYIKCMTSRIDYLKTSLLLNGLILIPISSNLRISRKTLKQKTFHELTLLKPHEFIAFRPFLYKGVFLCCYVQWHAFRPFFPEPCESLHVYCLQWAWQRSACEAQQAGSQCHRGL